MLSKREHEEWALWPYPGKADRVRKLPKGDDKAWRKARREVVIQERREEGTHPDQVNPVSPSPTEAERVLRRGLREIDKIQERVRIKDELETNRREQRGGERRGLGRQQRDWRRRILGG